LTPLERLRQPDSPHVVALADLMVDHALTRTVQELASDHAIHDQVVEVVRILAASQALRDRSLQTLQDWLAAHRHDSRTLGELLPSEARSLLETLLEKPWTPSRNMVVDALSDQTMRDVVRELVAGELKVFASSLRNIDTGMLGGLGGKAASKGRSLFGGVAGGLMSSVKGELTKLIDRALGEQLSGATDATIERLADLVCDPKRAPAFAAFRVRALGIAMDHSIADAIKEFEKLNPKESAELVADSLQGFVQSPDAPDRIRDLVQAAIEELGDTTLGDWLKVADPEGESQAHLRGFAVREIQRLVSTEAFGEWWRSLHS